MGSTVSAQSRVRVTSDRVSVWKPGFTVVATVVKTGDVLEVVATAGQLVRSGRPELALPAAGDRLHRCEPCRADRPGISAARAQRPRSAAARSRPIVSRTDGLRVNRCPTFRRSGIWRSRLRLVHGRSDVRRGAGHVRWPVVWRRCAVRVHERILHRRRRRIFSRQWRTSLRVRWRRVRPGHLGHNLHHSLDGNRRGPPGRARRDDVHRWRCRRVPVQGNVRFCGRLRQRETGRRGVPRSCGRAVADREALLGWLRTELHHGA